MKGKKGAVATWVIVLIFLGILSVVGIGVYVATTLSFVPVAVAVDYDGEFDDGFLATKGDFYNDFQEGTDCNITSDVLGGSGYTACIYNTSSNISKLNSTTFQFDFVIDIDNDVEDMEIEGKLQNTGVGQAKDDVNIIEAELWTYEEANDKMLVYEIPIDNEDGEFEGNTGVLVGDEYVLHVILKTKRVLPIFTIGDDIMRIKLDLTTDEDVDAARITLESG